MGEWKEIPLGELYEFSSGLSKPRSAFGSGYPFLGFRDVFYNSAVPDRLEELVNSTDRERDRCSIKRGDVFLTRTSETMEELGMSSVALRDIPDATFNGFTKRLRPKTPGRVIPEYARYCFRAPGFRGAVTAMSTLSTRASLNNDMLARLSIVLPPLAEQEAIGHILGTLDDKIELNRKMSETLEALARALFASWFVDFEPVRAKMDGRWQVGESLPGLPAELFGLFPNRLVDSDVGEIPEGWQVRPMKDLALNQRRSTRPDDIPSTTPYFSLGHMPSRSWALPDWEPAAGVASNKYSFERGEILFGKLRPYFHKVGVAPVDGVCSTDIVVIAPRDAGWFGLVLGHVSSDEFVAYTNAGSTGTRMPRTNWTYMGRYLVPVPSEPNVVTAFSTHVSGIVSRIQSGIHECRVLAELRDTLLPKLISGELGVRAAQELVGEAIS